MTPRRPRPLDRLRRRVRRGGAERGAVTALLAVLLSSGVLLGMGALVVDVGQLYAEDAQVQNGADSAALAVAAACAKNSTACDPSTTGLAAHYANANASDGVTAVTSVCGRDAWGRLSTSCPTPTGRPFDCGATPGASTRYAEVHTATRTAGGGSLLPPTFGRALMGSAYHGQGATACARATWGTPTAADGFALTISYCEWLAAVGGNAASPVYAPPPPATPAASYERVLYFHNTNPLPTHCLAQPSGADIPGDFGTTAGAPANCTTRFNFDPTTGTTTYGADPGSSLPGACQTVLLNARSTHTVVFIPIYDAATGSGSHGSYTMWRLAAFVITGYYWPSFNATSWLTGKQPCRGSARCLSGYFTTGVTTGGPLLPDSGAGAAVVQLMN